MAKMGLSNIKFTRSNVLIGVGLTAATIASIVLIRRRTFGAKLAQYISAKLEGRTNLYGNIKDYEDVFNGKSYIDNVKSIVNQKHKNFDFIALKDESVSKYRAELYDAMEAGHFNDLGTGLGTDSEKVKAVIRKLNDKVALAQVAQSYQDKYKRNLLDVMIDEMDENGEDMKEINDIVSTKLPFRLTNKR